MQYSSHTFYEYMECEAIETLAYKHFYLTKITPTIHILQDTD